MKKENCIPFPKFTTNANSRWLNIPTDIQTGILDSTWCVACRKSVRIVIAKAKMESSMLILEGTCEICGNKVVRTVEP